MQLCIVLQLLFYMFVPNMYNKSYFEFDLEAHIT
jgi:hypothetical protein